MKEEEMTAHNEKLNKEVAIEQKPRKGQEPVKEDDEEPKEPSKKLFPIFSRKKQVRKCQHSTLGDDYDFHDDEGETVVGSADVVGLYPACKAFHSGKVGKEMVMKSKMQIEGVNFKEAARYCVMKYSKAEVLANGLTRIVPRRRYRKGTKPGLTGSGPKGKVSDDELVWVFPNTEPTELEKRKLIACCVEIGIRAVFTSHLYEFDGKVYLQKDGGPIGVRLAGTVARAVMAEWDATLNKILESHRITVWMICR